MKISGRKESQGAGGVGPVGKGATPRRADAPSPAPPQKPDLEVSISPAAKDLQQAQAIVETLPDVRIELVSEIQTEIDKGLYHRDSKVIAKKMVNEALSESLKKSHQ